MFKTDIIFTQPDDNVYIIIQPDDNTKCEGKVSTKPGDNIYLDMITPNEQANAIQPE